MSDKTKETEQNGEARPIEALVSRTIWVLEFTTNEKHRYNDHRADMRFKQIYEEDEKQKLINKLEGIKRSNSLNPDYPDTYKDVKLYKAEVTEKLNWKEYG